MAGTQAKLRWLLERRQLSAQHGHHVVCCWLFCRRAICPMRDCMARRLPRDAVSCSPRREDGYLVGTRGGNMYSHAMATLALAEMWGMTGDKDIKPVLTKAVNLIVGSQNHEGGWRYEPRPTGRGHLRHHHGGHGPGAAKNSGLHVKDETMRMPSATSNAATIGVSAASRTCPISNRGSRGRRPAYVSCS